LNLIGFRRIFLTGLLIVAAMPAASGVHADEAATERVIDATSLRGKVLCGYQAWFRCPGDPSGEGWRHWSRSSTRIAPETVTFEMWPDTSEYAADELFEAPGFTHPGGRAARLFSSVHAGVVARHFNWMREYGIDGVFLQRFLVHVDSPSLDQVLGHVRTSAAKTGRVYALCYDLTGARSDNIVQTLARDWKRLVDEQKITTDERYLHHNGKPVVFVWGFYSDRFDAMLAGRVIDVFHAEGPYKATLIGGCQWQWRTEKNPDWSKVFRRLDIISPWNVGNIVEQEGRKYAATGYWKDDLAEAKGAGMSYLPVIYPGFGWTNLKGRRAAGQTIPRLGGEFFWRQFTAARRLEIDMAYVAMFDEVDEATAIFKVTNDPPTQGRFATYEGLPADWYLRLTSEGTKVIRKRREPSESIPIAP